jgi:hypothetical protein
MAEIYRLGPQGISLFNQASLYRLRRADGAVVMDGAYFRKGRDHRRSIGGRSPIARPK